MKLQKILERLQKLHPKEIDLSLNRIKRLCKKLGNPQENLVIGTRGSPLALAQANEVRNKILSSNVLDPNKVKIEIIKTHILLSWERRIIGMGGEGKYRRPIFTLFYITHN